MDSLNDVLHYREIVTTICNNMDKSQRYNVKHKKRKVNFQII